jgi:hypothetical protein
MLARMWWNRNPYTLLVGMQISTTTMKNSMELSQKTRDGIAVWSVILLLGSYPKEHKAMYSRDTCTPMFITLFTIAKLWKQSRCPTTDEWIMTLLHLYTKWSITQPQGIMTWSLMVNGCNWRTSCYLKLTRTWNTKYACFLSYVEDRSKDKPIHKTKHGHVQTQL